MFRGDAFAGHRLLSRVQQSLVSATITELSEFITDGHTQYGCCPEKQARLRQYEADTASISPV